MLDQVESFRKYYGENAAQLITGRAIHMDKIRGKPLSQVKEFRVGSSEKFRSLVREMQKRDCTPSDMSENNFLYDEELRIFSPVDITRAEGNTIDDSGEKYIVNYIDNRSVKIRF